MKDPSKLSSEELNEAKKQLLSFNWIDWLSIIMPCLRTKRAKLLEEVTPLSLGLAADQPQDGPFSHVEPAARNRAAQENTPYR